MDHFGRVVEHLAKAVPAEIADHAVAVLLGMALDRVADVAEMVARLRLFEPEHQAFIGHVDQAARLDRDVADQIHPAGVAMPAAEHRSDVDVDDVAVLERAIGRDAVADDMIDRDAAAMGVAAIAERRGHTAAGDRHVADDVVELVGAHAGDDVGHQRVEDLGGEAAGLAHALKACGSMELDRAVARLRHVFGDGHIFGHGRRYRRLHLGLRGSSPGK